MTSRGTREKFWPCARLGVLAGSLVWPSAASALEFTFTGLGDLAGGGFASWAWAISDDGSTVVGTSESDIGNEAFRWTAAAGITWLGKPQNREESFGRGVSADGSVVVGYGRDSLGNFEAYRWEGGSFTVLGNLPGERPDPLFTFANDVSADGSVMIGRGSRNQAFRWTAAGGYELLSEDDLAFRFANAVSADGTKVVGLSLGPSVNGPTPTQGVVWTQGAGLTGLRDLPGGSAGSNAYNISADGEFVVGVGNSASGREAFLWTEAGGLQGLGDLAGGAFDSVAYGVASTNPVTGQLTIVGQGYSDLGEEAFISIGGNNVVPLTLVLRNDPDAAAALEGWRLTSARDISADGSAIVGWGINPDGQEEAWLARIPEPAHAAALGVVLFGLRRRSS